MALSPRPPRLPALLALLALAGSSVSVEDAERSIRKLRGNGKVELPPGCLYDGRWHSDGSAVGTREACLACACARGALSCRRRACAPLPEPPPHCHVLQRRGDCCPQIQCPDGVNFQGIVGRFEDFDVATPDFVGLALPACVEGGTVYAAGSAMSSSTACEQCFCLGGARRCVRPQCLPPPPGCQPRPAPGACCPQRYYCEHDSDVSTERNPHDCKTSQGQWVGEGERVPSEDDCSQCFCLRGAIRCQHLSCAPNLQGCKPLVETGQCCPHQYQCNHTKTDVKPLLGIIPNLFTHPENYLEPVQSEERSLHPSKSTKRETTIKTMSTATDKKSTSIPTTKKQPISPTTHPKTLTTQLLIDNESTLITETTVKIDDYTKDTTTEQSTTEEISDSLTTEQPDGSVKIMINGTINCTAELSSTSLLYNITNMNDTLKMHMETQPRIPFADSMNIETHTFPANELITEKSYNEDFDENDTYVINVTSSLRTNTSVPSTVSTSTTLATKTVPLMLADSHNISKKTKEEADYDYAEPTLPPSLPNLKIIPFVAADAVVDDDLAPKEDLSSYPALEREDKFPVYYPSVDTKDIPFVTRREDTYNPTQYPVFPNKEESLYPLRHEIQETYAGHVDDVEKPMEFTVGTSFGSAKENKPDPILPITTDNMKVEAPAVNLFSPPVETEGGFIPKGPGIIDDYYAVYPSTPSGPVVPHLTTSMQLDDKGQCISNDGRQVAEGESVMQACSICTCAWGELHCSPRPCSTPPGCARRPTSADVCCGELVCEKANKTKVISTTTTERIEAINITQDIYSHKGENKINNHTKPINIDVTSTYNYNLIKNISQVGAKIKENDGSIPKPNTTTSSPTTSFVTTSTEKPTPISEIPTKEETNQNYAPSQEYEDEDDDEGFSLGNVLKLLLSETYETTTTVPFKKIPPYITTNIPRRTTTIPPSTTTTRKPPVVTNFVPTNQYSFIPSKKLNTVDRIDHLVLGEATAIKRTTLSPITTKLFTQTRKPFPKPTPRPITTKTIEITSKGQLGQSVEVSRPSNMLPGLIPGLPKLAGCNIYGRMYHVGRMIAELSTPCQECKCTELGVQCRPLTCS